MTSSAGEVKQQCVQLTGFEVWLEMGSLDVAEKRAPEQLPIVLQVLLSQQHRWVSLACIRRLTH